MGEDDLVSTSEAAKRLGVSPRTLQKWVRRNPPLVVPDITLPSGHHRWNVDRLLEQLREMRRAEGG